MSIFTGSLTITEVVPGKCWRLVDPICYESGAEGSGLWIEVPAGFPTDGATIPPALRVFLSVWGTYGRAAALHDYLYSLLRSGEWTAHEAFEGFRRGRGSAKATIGLARAWADAEFHCAMIACGTSRQLAWFMWAAVRLFGGREIKKTRGPKDCVNRPSRPRQTKGP